MKASTHTRAQRTSAALLALLTLSFQYARAGGFTALDAAWKEAVILAGVVEGTMARPEVVYAGPEAGGPGAPAVEYVPSVHEVRVYGADGRAPYYLVVQEFLDSIYSQMRTRPAGSDSAGQAESRDAWVRAKMSWRVKSTAFEGSPVLN